MKLYVEGMNCGGCVSVIQEALDAQDSINSVDIDLATKTVSLSTENSVESVKAILSDAGFESVEA